MFYHPSNNYIDCKVIVITLRDIFRFAAWGSQPKQCWMKLGSGEAPKIHTVARFTWNIKKINRTKTNLNLETIILRFHVELWGCIRILCIWIYGWISILVGGFSPFEKYYCSQNGNLPQVGVKRKIFETTT